MKIKDLNKEEVKIWDEWIKEQTNKSQYKVVRDLRSKPYGVGGKAKKDKREDKSKD